MEEQFYQLTQQTERLRSSVIDLENKIEKVSFLMNQDLKNQIESQIALLKNTLLHLEVIGK